MASTDPDSDIIPAIKCGDERAFGELLDRHLKTITGLATHLLGDPIAAEDAAQTTFLRTWQMMPNWEPGQAKLITWMRRVTTNLCFDSLKKKTPIFTDSLPEQVDEQNSPEDVVYYAHQKAMMQRALATLPDRQRLALTLSYFQNLSQKEGASVMEVSVSAYESLLVRARKTLKVNISSNSEFSPSLNKRMRTDR